MTKKLYPVTVDGIKYLISKDAEIKPLDWLIDTETTKLFQYYTKRGEVCSTCFKVTACEFPHKIEELYQFKLPDEDDDDKIKHIGYSTYGGYTKCTLANAAGGIPIDAFIKGYKANKAKWTDEDMEKAIEMAREGIFFKTSEFTTDKEWDWTPTYILQSLNKHKEVEYYKVEMKEKQYHYISGGLRSSGKIGGKGLKHHEGTNLKPILNKEGIIIAKPIYK